MKLKKKHFKRLQEIAEKLNHELNYSGMSLSDLITDIESVQKPKTETVQESPLNTTGFIGNIEFSGNIFNDAIRAEFSKSYMRQGESMVASSTDQSTEFKGGLRDAVEDEYKVGDVGYFWGSGNVELPVLYGVLKEIDITQEYPFITTTGQYRSNFSKTPPELK